MRNVKESLDFGTLIVPSLHSNLYLHDELSSNAICL